MVEYVEILHRKENIDMPFLKKAICLLLVMTLLSGCGADAIPGTTGTPVNPGDSTQPPATMQPETTAPETQPPETPVPETTVPETEPPHMHDYTVTVLQGSTCTTNGLGTFTCKDCDYSYVGPLGALGHSYKQTVVEPTCTEAGYTRLECTRCGHTTAKDGSEVKPRRHNYYHELIPGENGCTLHTCRHCGAFYQDCHGNVTIDPNIPEELLDSYIMRSWAYLGVDVRGLADSGELFVKYGAYHHANITYASISGGCMGYECVKDSSTITGYAPNVSAFKVPDPYGGLVCAGFVTYYALNYLRWIEGIDLKELREAVNQFTADHGYNCRGVLLWEKVLTNLSNAPDSSVQRIYQAPYEQDVEIPESVYDAMKPGDLVIFGRLKDNGSREYSHIGVYAGTWNGKHFLLHQPGGSNGPRLDAIEEVSIIDPLMPHEEDPGPYDHITAHPVGVYRLADVQ